MSRHRLATLFLLLAAPAAAWAQTAASYPNKPIRLVVGFAPGGAADIISRAISDPFGRALGQAIIVDNRPGAGSSIAAEHVAKAQPDGYTMLIASPSSLLVNPVINKNVGYNTERDFAPISKVTASPLVVAVHPAVPVHSIPELIAHAKQAPGKLNFASSGNGSAPHLAAVLFASVAGLQMVHVPFKGGGPAVQSVLAGDTHVTFATPPSVLPLVQAGRLRGLAVTSRGRTPLVPGLPGMEEAGLSNYDISFWYGFLAPAATPAAIIQRLFEATTVALQHPPFRQALERDGTETAVSRSPEDFARFLREESKLWERLIRESGAKLD